MTTKQGPRMAGQGSHTRIVGRPAFDRKHLPSPAAYFTSINLTLFGHGTWRSAVCPFHNDSRPSLRVNVEVGCFKCMSCGTHGGDVLAFHMLLHGLPFVAAAKALNAWRRS